MFKNHQINVSLAKKGELDTVEVRTIDIKQVNEFLLVNGKRFALAFVAVYTAVTVVKTTSKVVVTDQANRSYSRYNQ